MSTQSENFTLFSVCSLSHLPPKKSVRETPQTSGEKRKGGLMRERRGAPLSDVSAWAVLVLVLIAHGASVCNGGMGTWRHARGGSFAAEVCQRRSGVPHLQALRLIMVNNSSCVRAHTAMTRVGSVHACTRV
jgi:hypothetical protein